VLATVHAPVPWVGLVAVVAMFVLPWLDARGLFDGRRTVRHRPRREVCGDCAEPWARGHGCAGWQAPAGREPVVPLGSAEPPARAQGPIRAQLIRADQPGRLALPQRERRS
jgi:hypothetical protein